MRVHVQSFHKAHRNSTIFWLVELSVFIIQTIENVYNLVFRLKTCLSLMLPTSFSAQFVSKRTNYIDWYVVLMVDRMDQITKLIYFSVFHQGEIFNEFFIWMRKIWIRSLSIFDHTNCPITWSWSDAMNNFLFSLNSLWFLQKNWLHLIWYEARDQFVFCGNHLDHLIKSVFYRLMIDVICLAEITCPARFTVYFVNRYDWSALSLNQKMFSFWIYMFIKSLK